MVKHKVDAVLILDDLNRPAGVVSKTDLISACYTMLPVETPAGNLVARELVFCYADDLLEDAINRMQTHGIDRIYVRGKPINEIIGTLSCLEVVGLLYKYCRKCPRSIFRQQQENTESVDRLRVREVMSTALHTCRSENDLSEVIETLTTSRCGAALILDGANRPAGVISKSDLVLACKHGRPISTPAGEIMQHPVWSCAVDSILAKSLQVMLIRDILQIFVYPEDPGNIVGVHSLSDSARFRSGSCRACIPGRMMTDD